MTMRRRQFLRSLLLASAGAASLGASTPLAQAIGPRSRFSVAQLRYDGGLWDPRPGALGKLLLEVEKRTSILVDQEVAPVAPGDEALFRYPFLLWAGDRGFPPFDEAAIQNLSLYMRAGGFVLIDSSEGARGGAFDRSVRRELERAAPAQPLEAVDRAHVVYKSFYLLGERAWGRLELAPLLEALPQHDRLMAVYSQNDLQGAWARDNFGNHLHDVTPGGERQREYSYRYGINLVMYALCINYKADQVHIPFILRRRQWQID